MDIWNDEQRLASHVNRLRALVMIGGQFGRKIKLRTGSFSGVKTIGAFWMNKDTSCRYDYELLIKEGRAKIIIVRGRELTNLTAETSKGTRIVRMPKGWTRIRVVGEKTDIEFKMELTKGITDLE
ncbi:MAG: hypothetical protein WC344_04965 [Bacilli bacterium]|jgi:hypothetical protein